VLVPVSHGLRFLGDAWDVLSMAPADACVCAQINPGWVKSHPSSPHHDLRGEGAPENESIHSSPLSLLHPDLPQTSPRHRITESQHGRGWKGPLWVTQPNPLPKQGHLRQAAQDRVQAGLEYLQRRNSTASLGSLGQGSVTLRGKKFFLIFSWSFLCFSLCPLPLVL